MDALNTGSGPAKPRQLAVVSIIVRDTPHGHFNVYYSQMPDENEMTTAALRELELHSPAISAGEAILAYLEERARQVIKKSDPHVVLVVP